MGKMIGAIVVDTEACKGCSLCVAACPQKILNIVPSRVNRKGYPYANMDEDKWDKCTGCASCAIVCPDSCISVYRKKL
jgi:2-oxoglutarate ferredoxin oxidoreductase subunit delta